MSDDPRTTVSMYEYKALQDLLKDTVVEKNKLKQQLVKVQYDLNSVVNLVT